MTRRLCVAVLVVFVGLGWLGEAAWAQDKAPDSRLVGKWEGDIQTGDVKFDPARTLIIEVREGQLAAVYGVTGRKLWPVALSVTQAGDGRPVINFRTGAGATVTLSIVKDGWLSGSMRGTAGNEMPMQLERKGSP